MKIEQIKEMYSMRDILNRYGITPNRSGYCPCPFHQEKSASLKVYEKDFNCFGCGANGDIFKFVELMEDISFKEAFQSLGGTYGRPDFASRLAIYKSKKHKEMRQKARERLENKKQLNNTLITVYRSYMDKSEPFGTVWCDCYNALQYQLYIQAELNGLESRW